MRKGAIHDAGGPLGLREIAAELGVSRGTVFNAYRSAIAKLRRNGVRMAHLQALAGELERGRRGECRLIGKAAR